RLLAPAAGSLAGAKATMASGRSPGETQVQASRGRAREQLVYRALLELELLAVMAADKDEQERLRKRRADLSRAVRSDEAARTALAQAGPEIRDSYTQLGPRLRAGSEVSTRPRAEIALRLAPARMADAVESQRTRLASLGEPLRWREVLARLVLEPPANSDRPQPLESGTAKTFRWRLRSAAKAFPARVKIALHYPETLLQVRDEQEKPLPRTWDLIIPPQVGREEYPLPLLVMPLAEDGSQTTLTVELPDDGLRAPIQVQLPQPRFLDVQVSAQAGTIDGAPTAAEQPPTATGWSTYQPKFDPNGVARVTLRPHPSGPTAYDITLRNAAKQPWVVKTSVRVLPADQRERLGRQFRPWDETLTKLAGSQGQAENQFSMGAGATAPLPLFLLPPGPAAKPAAEGTAVAASAPAAAGPVDVSGGLLCVLDHPGQRQLLWLDVRPQHPEEYLQPEVQYDSTEQRVGIRITASNASRLPPGTCSARWELPRGVNVREAHAAAEMDLHGGASLELDGRVAVDLRERRSIPVVITVDGYPRAFEFERFLSIGKSDRKTTSRLQTRLMLFEIDEKGLPKKDERGNLVEVPPNSAFAKLDQLGVLVQADMPPTEKVDRDYRLRVYIQRPSTSDINQAKGESVEFYRDRRFTVNLEKPQSSPGFVLRSTVEDLTAILKTSSYQNQRITVRGEIEELPRDGSASRIIKAEPPDLAVLHDNLPPRVLAPPSLRILQGDPITLEVDEDPSGIVALLVATECDEQGRLREPKRARRQESPRVRASFRLDLGPLAPGEHLLYVAAKDGAGNTSDPQPLQILVEPKPESAKPDSPMAEPKSIVGSVVYGNSPQSDITITLTGPKTARVTSHEDGTFKFTDLPPGQYQVQAKGKVAGVLLVSPEDSVDLTGEKPIVIIRIHLKG
ncbi:MAG: carboxypeptidase-like regulatory domain-containing protein, partial [Planctomycetota bacterium]|nr:carboxypeptidase-like regulatory domain-containing protein [Planctomycetota bacterium]